MSNERIAVLGLGNVLQGDDAVGPYVVEILLATYEFPPGVTVLDVGTPGLDLTPYLAGCEAVIIVDAVRATGEPGELRAYRRDELLATPLPHRLSPHDPGVKECLLALELAEQAPREVLLVGVIPERVETGVGLSATVRGALPALAAAVLEELRRLGRPATAKTTPSEPNIWWEKRP